jgi:predicted MFS family arabinose efflux permease
MAAGPLSLYALSNLAPLMASDLPITSSRLGILAAVSYGSAAVSAFWFGKLVDVVAGDRPLLLLLFAGSALSIAVVAFAGSFPALIVAMVIGGVAQSGSNPITNRAVSSHVPLARQGTFVGIKQSGVQVQQFFVGAAMVPIAVLAGWRPAVALGLVLVLIGVIAAMLSIPRVPQLQAGSAPAAATTSASAFPLTRLLIYTFCNGALVTSINVHVVLFGFNEVGLGAGTAGALAGVIGGVGVVGRIAWGQIAQRRTTFAELLRLLAALSVVSVLCMWASMAGWGLLLWLGTAVFAMSAVPGNVVAMLAVVRSAASGKTGAITGVVMIALYSGFMFGPFVFGLIADGFGGYNGGWAFATGLAAVSLASMTGLPDEVKRSRGTAPSDAASASDEPRASI